MTATSEALASRLQLPSERWNPILVKEVRQALRGRTFRWTFIATLMVAVIGVMGNLVGFNHVGEDVQGYFMTVHFCLVAALVGMVPFSAFQAMGFEWEESTSDLLLLSALRPRRIVAGKLQAALVQSALFFAAFSPFLVVAYLFPGVDLAAALIYLAIIMIVSLLATMVALALSTLSRQRFARVLLMLLIGAQAAWLVPMLMVLGDQILRNPQEYTSDSEFRSVAATLGLFACIGGAYVFTLACNMLAHPEENRSSNTRILTTISVLALGGYAIWFVNWTSASVDVVNGIAMFGLGLLSLIGVLLTTERREMGRRVATLVPRSAFSAMVTAPWFPGGGRGVVYHILHVVLIVALALSAVAWKRPSAPDFFSDGVGALIVAALLSVFYVTFLAGVLSRLCERAGPRLYLRVATPLVALLGAFIPGLIGAFIGDRQLANLEHLGNPLRLIERAWTQDGVPSGRFAIIAGAALVAVLVNLPRLVSSATETLAAVQRNIQRAATKAGPDA